MMNTGVDRNQGVIKNKVLALDLREEKDEEKEVTAEIYATTTMQY